MFDTSASRDTVVNRVVTSLLLALAVVTPLVVLPFFTNFMVTSKLLVMAVASIIFLSVFIWQTLRHQSFELPKSALTLPLGLFLVSALASSLFTTSYPVENILGMGGVYIGFAIIAILGGAVLKRANVDTLLKVLTVTGSVLSVLSLVQALGFGPSRVLNAVFNVGLPHTGIFNLTGSPFIAVQFLGVLLLAHAVSFLFNRKVSRFQLANLPLLLVGFAMSLWTVLPGKEAAPVLLPFGVSWSIATDVMKAPRSALIGVGPENFSSAYMLFRPSWTNAATWWSNVFGQAANVPLTLLVTGGLLSMLAWFWVALKAINIARNHIKDEPVLATLVIATFVLQLIFPSNAVMMTIQAIALAALIGLTHRGMTKIHILKPASFEANLPAQSRSAILFLIPVVIAGLIGGALLFGLGRAYAASNAFLRSSTALQQNDAVRTYDLQRQAVELNPYISLYRSNYALTNFAIATALSNKANLSDQEREQVAQLIQQAIREGRAASLLRPDDSQSWRVLAQIYRNLIGTAEGADQWALSAYVEAINSHPSDPSLRVEVGGMFLSAQQFAQAVSLFQQAAELKPDYANAYYNLANALKAANQLDGARSAYQQTLALLPADSEDYIKANQELEALEAAIAATASGTTRTASPTPTPTPSPTLPSLLNQNLNESQDAVVSQPSGQELQVSQQPSALPSPTPTPSPATNTP